MSQTSVAQINQLVAANIRAEAARSNTPHQSFAHPLGVSAAQVSARLNGRVPLSIGEVVVVATLLGVPLAKLLDGVETETAVPA